MSLALIDPCCWSPLGIFCSRKRLSNSRYIRTFSAQYLEVNVVIQLYWAVHSQCLTPPPS